MSITKKDSNLLLQFREQLINQETSNIVVGGNKDTKDKVDGLYIDIDRWKLPETLESKSRRALKPFVIPQMLLAVKVERSNISVWYSKGNTALQNIDVYTVDPKKPRLFYCTKLDHVWVKNSWVYGAISRKNLEHGRNAALYLPATAYEYPDAHGDVKYGLRRPCYHDAALDLNQYQIMK